MLLMIRVIDSKKHLRFPVTSFAVYNKSETFGIVSNLGIRIFGLDVGLYKANLTILIKKVKKVNSKSTFDKFNSKTCLRCPYQTQVEYTKKLLSFDCSIIPQ